MTERGGERGGRSSAKAGPAEGRGRGVSPDAAGSEVGSGMTGLLSVPTRPLLRAEGSCAFASCRAHALGPPAPAPTPQAWFLPALPSFPVRTIFAMLLGAMARCSWCHQHATLASPSRRTLRQPASARPSTACTTQFWPARSSSEPPGGRWTQVEPQGPCCLPRPFPSSQQPHVLRRSSRLRLWGGLLPGIHPLLSPTPEGARAGVGSSVWAGQEGLPDPGVSQRWPPWASRSAALPPRRSQDVETGSHWPVEVTAGCHGQERAVLGSQGRHSVHTALSKCGAQPGPSGRKAVTQKSRSAQRWNS